MTTELLDQQELFALARLDFEKERYDQALIRLKQIVADDGSAEAWALLGNTYARLRLWAKAQSAFQKFLKAHPEALTERFQLGMTFFDAGDNAQALAEWQQVLKADKAHPPSLFHSALANARLGHLPEALRLCEAALAVVPPDNLFHGRAKDLAEKLRQDPRLAEPAAPPAARKKH